MKKTLLTLSIIVSSCFFTYAAGLSGTIDLGGGVVITWGDSQAQGGALVGTSLGLINLAQVIVSRLVPLLVGIAVLAFFWFLIEYIWKGREDPEVYRTGRAGMFYSVLAIFVMVSIWGLVGFLGNLFGIEQGGNIHGFKLPGAR
jgi:hypothetical protein